MAAATVAALSGHELILDDSTALHAAAENPVYELLIAWVSAGDWHPHRDHELARLRQFYGVRDRLRQYNRG